MTAPSRFRLFIALPAPAAVKAAIQVLQAELRGRLPDRCARWTRPEQLHLTLKFLGDVERAQLESLTEAVQAVCARFAPLRLRAEGVGCFPDLRLPRVVWVGITDLSGQLPSLQSALKCATAAHAEEMREKEFTGHITIARTKHLSRPEAELLAQLLPRQAECRFGEWTAAAVELMRSELASAGATHTCLARLPLNGAA